MELRSLFQIEQVLVVDGDEFLFCDTHGSPPGMSLQAMQKHAIQTTIQTALADGVEEIDIERNGPVGWQGKPIESCINKAVISNQSLFGCYDSSQFRVLQYASKHFAMKHVCPFTGVHASCQYINHANSKKVVFPCQCEKKKIQNCFIIHIRAQQLPSSRKNKTRGSGIRQLELKAMMDHLPRPVLGAGGGAPKAQKKERERDMVTKKEGRQTKQS
jgi:hypothetical protein